MRICSRAVSRSKNADACSCTPIRGSSRGLRGHGGSPSSRTVAGVGPAQPLDHLQRRGLAGAVGPEDAEELPAARPSKLTPSTARQLPVASCEVGDLDRSPLADQARGLDTLDHRGLRQRARPAASVTDAAGPTDSRARSACSSAQISLSVRDRPGHDHLVARPPSPRPGPVPAASGVGRRPAPARSAGRARRAGRRAARRGPSSASGRRAAAPGSGRPASAARAARRARSASGPPRSGRGRRAWRSRRCPSTMYAGGSTATRTARSSGTPRLDQRVAPRSKASASRPVSSSGSAAITCWTTTPKASTVASLSIGGRRLLTSQREARSTRVRISSRIWVCTSASMLVVEGRRSRRCSARDAEDLAGHEVGPRQLVGRGAGLPRQPVEERDAGAVDQVVDDLGHDDLAAQRVLLHLVAVALAHLAPGSRRTGRCAGTGRRAGRCRAARRRARSWCRPAAPTAPGAVSPCAALEPRRDLPCGVGSASSSRSSSPCRSSRRIQSSCTCSSGGAWIAALASARFCS